MAIKRVKKNNKWQFKADFYFRDAKGKLHRPHKFKPTRKEAERWLIECKQELLKNNGKPKASNPYRSIDEVIENFFNRPEYKQLARKTRQTYRSRIEGTTEKGKATFRRWCVLNNITHLHQLKGKEGKELSNDFYFFLKDNLSNSAPDSYLNTVVDLFNVEMKRSDSILEVNPFAGQKRNGKRRTDIRYFEQEERWALEKVMGDYESAVFQFILHLGLRVDEFQTLTWAQVKGKRALDCSDPLRVEIVEHMIERQEKDEDGVFRLKKILWTPKTVDGERVIPLDRTAERALEYFRERTKGNNYVGNVRKDAPLSHNFVNKLYDRVQQQAVKFAPTLAKIGDRSKDASAKTFRATFGSLMLQSGRSMEDVGNMLGHEGTRTTRMSYARLNLQSKIDSVASLDDLIEKQRSSDQA